MPRYAICVTYLIEDLGEPSEEEVASAFAEVFTFIEGQLETPIIDISHDTATRIVKLEGYFTASDKDDAKRQIKQLSPLLFNGVAVTIGSSVRGSWISLTGPNAQPLAAV